MGLKFSNFFGSIKSYLKRKKTIQCKYCSKLLRVPYIKGKTLRVYCPNCGNRFEVIYPN